MDIKIDIPQMQELIAQAVFASLDEIKRDVLTKGAIQHLITKSGDYYNGRSSPIEQAFQYAVRDVAQKIATEVLTNDASVQEKMRSLLNEALARLMEKNREATVTKLADSIAAGMAYRDRD